MAQTRRRSQPVFRAGQSMRPGQDMGVVRRQAGQFPAVGMTLRSYKYDPRDRHHVPAAGTVVKRGFWRRLKSKTLWKRLAITLVTIVVLIGGWVGFKFLYNAHRLFGGSIFDILSSTKLKGEDSGRVNILLAGNSADDPGHQGADLTDSIMVLSIDTRNNTAFLLSVPRDMYVQLPAAADADSTGHGKINQAILDNNFSESGFPNGGMGDLEQVVEQNFNINIDYYVLVNYGALRDAVNAVGGINFTVKGDDGAPGIYDPDIDWSTHKPLVDLSNGVHHIDGQQALDIARARGDAYGSYGINSDYSRTQNQRQMILDIKHQAMTAGVLANPARLTSLFDAVGSNVKTDLNLADAKRLYQLMKPISNNNIKSLGLNNANGKNLLANYETPTGESALIPAAGLDDFSDIQAFLRQQTSNNPIVREGADVVVLNATEADGLAAKQRTLLTGKGVNVSAIGDAYSTQATTTIVDASNGKLPKTRALLVKQYGNTVITNSAYENVYPNADFIIIVGEDQAPATAAASSTSATAQ